MNNSLQRFILLRPGGFIKQSDMPELAAIDRLCPVLVRCGGCRFTCAAQDAPIIIRAIERDGDYLRDVSFPVGSMERAASWQPEAPIMETMTPPNAIPMRTYTPVPPATNFDPSDCGGVWDGFQVTSDADPGL